MRFEPTASDSALLRRARVERAFSLFLVLILLTGGLLLGRRLDRARSLEAGVDAPAELELGIFRNWLWERRGLDLLAQIALVFAGTLGIAAILPNSHEETGPPGPSPGA